MRLILRARTAVQISFLVAALLASCALPSYHIDSTTGTTGSGTSTSSGAGGETASSSESSSSAGGAGGDAKSSSASSGGAGGQGGAGGGCVNNKDLVACPPEPSTTMCDCPGNECYFDACGSNPPLAKKFKCDPNKLWVHTTDLTCCKKAPRPCDPDRKEACVVTITPNVTSGQCVHDGCADLMMPLGCDCVGPVCDMGLVCSPGPFPETLQCTP